MKGNISKTQKESQIQKEKLYLVLQEKKERKGNVWKDKVARLCKKRKGSVWSQGKNQGGPTQLKLSGGIPEVFKLVPTDTTRNIDQVKDSNKLKI